MIMNVTKNGRHFLSTIKREPLNIILPVFGIVIIVFWQWLLPGVRVANDLPAVSHESLVAQFDLPQTWQDRGDGLGEYSVFTLWSWPMTFLSGFLAKLGITFAVQERIIFIFPAILFGTYGIFKILSGYKLSKPAMFVSSVLYLVNTYMILLIDGGQLSVALTYAFFPFVFYLIAKAIGGDFKRKLLAGISTSIFGYLDIRFVYVMLLLVLGYVFYEFLWLNDKKKWLFSSIASGVIIFLVFGLLHFYWIFPILKHPLSTQMFSSLTELSGLNFTRLRHGLLLYSPHWHKNVFGKVSLPSFEFILIPIVVFLAPFVSRKFKSTLFWVLVAIISVFLAKGGNTPLPHIYPWLYDNVPGFSLFRDSTKFFFLIGLSYSVLTAFTVDFLVKKLDFKLIIPVLFTTYYILLVSPVWKGQLTGMFAKPISEEEFGEVSKVIATDSSFSRVFWINSKAPLGYSSPLHPGVEASRFQSLRPFSVGIVGTYERLNFLREAEYMGELFDIFGIKYIIFPYPDIRREELKQDNIDYYHAFNNQLMSLPWIEERIYGFPINAYKTRSSQDRFFLAPNTWLVFGTDRIYTEFAPEKNNKLSQNALIFAEENLDNIKLLKNPEVKPLLYDVTGEEAPQFDKYLFLADFVGTEPSEIENNAVLVNTGWWKREAGDFVWLRNFLEQKYSLGYQEFTYQKGVAISEGAGEIIIDKSLIQENKALYARVLVSPRGGVIKFFQGERLIGEVNTKVEDGKKETRKLTGYEELEDQYFEYDKASFRTSFVGNIGPSGNLKIVTEGDVNIINFLATAEGEELTDLANYSYKEELFESKSDPKVSYEELSSTHYKVRVSGIDKPMTLVFSQRYDENWKINGEPSYPVYSVLNGFSVPKDGEYDIFFEPQRFILPGLAVSLSAATAITSYFLYTFLNARKSTKSS